MNANLNIIKLNRGKSQGDMVAHTGFEPVVSSLRGTRPRPLDECAVNLTMLPAVFS
jgi:hypothetical protein